MRKTLLLLLTCVGFGLAADTADINSFFPMDKGFTWTYDTLDKKAAKHFDMRVEIQDSWKDGDAGGMIMKQKDKRGTMREFLLKKEDGIFIQRLGLSKSYTPEVFSNFTPPVPRVIAPLVPGTQVKWEGRLKAAGVVNKAIRFSGEVVGWEDVKVPAGTFHCIKLFYDQYRDNDHVQEYAWYAAGVGQVKYDSNGFIKELKEFKKP
jgi:hypothetical protein